MTCKNIYVVFAERLIPCQQLLSCIGSILVCIARQTAIVCSTITNVRVIIGLAVRCTVITISLYHHREVVWQINLTINLCIDYCTTGLILVSSHLVCDVTVREVLRGYIKLLLSILIKRIAAICIMHIHRIHRRHVTGDIEWVSISVTRSIVVELTVRNVGTQVDTTFEPLAWSKLRVDTASETLESRVLGITLLVQVTGRSINIKLLTTYSTRNVVLLTMTCTLNTILPIEVVITREARSNQLAVCIKQSIILCIVDISLYIVANQVSCSVLSSSCSIQTHRARHSEVLHCQPRCLHPLVSTQTLILTDTTGINTIVDLEIDSRLDAILCTLGSNQDNTIGSTVTIEGCRSSILQYRHALDVVRVQLRDVTIESCAIYHIKRLVSILYQGSDTTDVDRRSLTWLTV